MVVFLSSTPNLPPIEVSFIEPGRQGIQGLAEVIRSNSGKVPVIDQTIFDNNTAHIKLVEGVIDPAMKMAKPLSQISTPVNSQNILVSPTGGIDLNSVYSNLTTQHSGGEIRFQINSAMLANLEKARGFTVGSITIQPLKDISEFLGINQPQPSSNIIAPA